MLALILSMAIVIADQVTKTMVRERFFPGMSLPVVEGLFNLTYVRNTGAAWGMLIGLNGWLAIVSAVMAALMVFFRRAFLADCLTHRIALGVMLGGILGNFIDRVKLHYVVDFLDFHWQDRHFPAFNVADAAICIGVFLYALSTWWISGRAVTSCGAAAGLADKGGAK